MSHHSWTHRGIRWLSSCFASERWRERERQCLRTRVARALKPAARGGVLNDVLSLKAVSACVTVEWYARDVHPWDRDLPAESQAELLLDTARIDTLAAIRALFGTLPEVSEMRIRVIEPHAPHQALFDGTVLREDADDVPTSVSPAMQLNILGIRHVRHCSTVKN